MNPESYKEECNVPTGNPMEVLGNLGHGDKIRFSRQGQVGFTEAEVVGYEPCPGNQCQKIIVKPVGQFEKEEVIILDKVEKNKYLPRGIAEVYLIEKNGSCG